MGCGAGRYYQCLKDITKYQGYDQSIEMIINAKFSNKDASFACVDITNFQSNEKFDTGICIDVTYHQKDPVGFMETVFRLWDCERLFFTLLVGEEHQELYNSIVISKTAFERLLFEYNLEIKHIKQLDNFDWVVLQK